MPALALALLALAAPAFAHRPHQVVTALFAPADFDASGRAWAVLDPNRVSMLLRSDDHGRHWDFVGGAPTEDILVDGAYFGKKLVLLGEDGTAWTSADEGASWSGGDLGGAPLPGGTVAVKLSVVGEKFVVATTDGLYAGNLSNPRSAGHARQGESFSYAAVDAVEASRMAASTDPGGVAVSADSGQTWGDLPALPGEALATAVAYAGGTLYVGADAGVFAWDGAGWLACGGFPVTSAGQYEDYVVHLVGTSGGSLAAASGRQAIFRSDDACATWTLADAGDAMVPEYGGVGNARSARDAFRGIVVGVTHLLVGGFNGVAASTDGGATWTYPKLMPADYLRGASLAPGFPADRRLWTGLYGGGAAWTADGGRAWLGSAAGILDTHSYDVEPSADEGDTVFYAGLSDAYRSTDGGRTWSDIDVPMQRNRRYRSIPGRTYVIGEDSGEGIFGRVAVSLDSGQTWSKLNPLHEVMVHAVPRDVAVTSLGGREVLLVTADAPCGVLGSYDGGASWTWLLQEEDSEDNLAAGTATWPPEDPTRLVYAGAQGGVFLSDDGGETWRAPISPPSATPRQLHGAESGLLLLASRGGGLWTSLDGGETWSESTRLPVAIHDLDSAPGYGADGLLLAGTQAGAYWSGDAAESWHLLPRYERFEDDTYHLQCSPAFAPGSACRRVLDAAAGNGGGWLLVPGDRVSFSYTGESFRVLRLGEAASLQVTVAGPEPASLVVASAEAVATPGEGWKDVTVEVLDAAGGGFFFDGVEALHGGEALPGVDVPADSGTPDTAGDSATAWSTHPPGSRCDGCRAGGVGVAGWAAGLAVAGARRRRRRDAT